MSNLAVVYLCELLYESSISVSHLVLICNDSGCLDFTLHRQSGLLRSQWWMAWSDTQLCILILLESLLGWHVLVHRAKIAQLLYEVRNLLMKMIRKSPQNVWAFILCPKKNVKIPQNAWYVHNTFRPFALENSLLSLQSQMMSFEVDSLQTPWRSWSFGRILQERCLWFQVY